MKSKKKLDRLFYERDLAAVNIIRDMDINSKEGYEFILQYTANAYKNNSFGNFNGRLNNIFTTVQESVPLLFAYMEWLNYYGELEEESAICNKLNTLSASEGPEKDYIENRHTYLASLTYDCTFGEIAHIEITCLFGWDENKIILAEIITTRTVQ